MRTTHDKTAQHAPQAADGTRGRKRVAFLQGDVTRAIKGAKAAGLEPGPVEIWPDGRIVILPRGTAAAEASDPLEKWEANYRARKA